MIRIALAYLRRHHLGLLALMVALGGTAYAANSVNSSDVKNETIRSADIKDNAITADDLNDKSVPTAVFSATIAAFGGTPDLVNSEGITGLEQTGVGTYEVNIPGGAECNFALTATFPDRPTGPVAIYLGGAQANEVTFITANSNGQPTNLGADLGYSAFDVLASCPD
jgi:hypothetical protein